MEIVYRTRVGAVLLVMIAILAIPIAVNAQSYGLGVQLSSGDNSLPWSMRAAFKSDSGSDLTPAEGVSRPPRGEGLNVQIIIVADENVSPDDYELWWSTLAAPQDRQWTKAGFDPKSGWSFRVDPSQYLSGEKFDTPLQLQLWRRHGRQHFIRLIFQINTGTSSTVNREVLLIRPYDPAPAPAESAPGQVVADPAAIDRNFDEVKGAVGVLSDNQQVLAGRADNFEARVTRLEGAWSAQAGSPAATVAPAPLVPPCVVTVPVAPTDRTMKEMLMEKYAGRIGYVFFTSSPNPVTKQWWLSCNRGWVRADNNLVVTAADEKYWLYDASDLARKGWTALGIGSVSDDAPTEVYPLDAKLHVLEER